MTIVRPQNRAIIAPPSAGVIGVLRKLLHEVKDGLICATTPALNTRGFVVVLQVRNPIVIANWYRGADMYDYDLHRMNSPTSKVEKVPETTPKMYQTKSRLIVPVPSQ